MAITPNTVANFAIAPIPIGPVINSPFAKITFNDQSSLARLLDPIADRRQVVTSLYVEVTASVVAGKIAVFLSNGTSAGNTFQIADVPHAALTVNATTGVPPITFPFSPTNPLIVPEGYTLWIGTMVNQTNGAMVVYGTGKVF